MNILVTGGAGYLGSVLLPKLLIRGHSVRVLDIGYFGLGHLTGIRPKVEVIREDLRRLTQSPQQLDRALDGCSCVLHLAAISNDPSADLHPELTEDINFAATVALAEQAKRRGCRFVFSSSCSVYGQADGELTEDSPTGPLTVYAVSKLKAEQSLEAMATSSWRPVILRNGTLYGYSPRMRFDLVINIFSLYSSLHNEIRVFGAGDQYRPFLHVSDCARAFLHLCEQPALNSLRYNVASENLRVNDVAAIFQCINPRMQVVHVPTEDIDRRDYRVNTKRMEETGFRPLVAIRSGIEEMMEAIVSGVIADPESLYYRNAKWLKELMDIGSRDHRSVIDLMESFPRAWRAYAGH